MWRLLYLLDNGIDYAVKYSGENMTNMDAIAFVMERGQTKIADVIREFESADESR